MPPEGESVAVFNQRVELAWRRVERIAAATDGHLAVVTHGIVCRTLVQHHMEGAPAEADAMPRWTNTCLTIAEAGPRWRVRLLACTAHLDEDGGSRDGAAV